VARRTILACRGPRRSARWLSLQWDRTNAAQPDVICILGDLVIQGVLGGRFVPPEEIAVELARLRAPAGVVAVLGNHDGWFDHDRVKQA